MNDAEPKKIFEKKKTKELEALKASYSKGCSIYPATLCCSIDSQKIMLNQIVSFLSRFENRNRRAGNQA